MIAAIASHPTNDSMSTEAASPTERTPCGANGVQCTNSAEPAEPVTATATIPSVYAREDAVQVEYVVGYEDGDCPDSLRLAVLSLAAHFYENRESVLVGTVSKEIEMATTALCSPYRVWWRPPCL